MASAPDSVDDGLPARGDVGERLGPAHRRELPFALAPGALERVQHAVRVIDTLQVVVDLGAQRAARERMRGIAGQTCRRSVLNLHGPGARVGAVVPAGSPNGCVVAGGSRHRPFWRHDDFTARAPRPRGCALTH